MKEWHVAAFAAVAISGAFAAAPTWDGDKIIFDDGGIYDLEADASASGLYFNAPATLAGTATLTLTNPAAVYGSGTVLVPLSGTDGMSITNAWYCPNNVYPQKDGWTTIWVNSTLSLISKIEGVIYGNYNKLNGERHYWQTKTVAFARLDSGNVTAQFHMLNAVNQPRAMKVEFRQNGNNVEAKLIWAKYSADTAKFALDWDNTGGLNSYGDATFNASSICVTEFCGKADPLTLAASSLPSGPVSFNVGEIVVSPPGDLTLTSAVSGSADSIVFRGSKASADDESPCVIFSPSADNTLSRRPTIVFDGIDAKMTSRTVATLPPHYEIVLTNNAILTDSAPYQNRAQFYGASAWSRAEYDSPTNALVVTKGCKCVARTGDWTFGDKLKVIVDGGVLDLGARSHYINSLVLANGGCVIGTKHHVGNAAAEMRLATSGEGLCEIQGYIAMSSPHSTLAGMPYVFDTQSDLTVGGGLKQWSTGVCDILKTGAATLAVGNVDVSSVAGAPGAVRIEDGRLLLAANDAFSRTNAVTLAGGCLDAGSSTNRLGVLSLAGNASIAIGEGQMTFSDSSSVAWTEGAMLSVTGSDEKLKSGRVRFLLDGGSGLSASQLGCIAYNGDWRVSLDADGWLRSSSAGMLIIIK